MNAPTQAPGQLAGDPLVIAGKTYSSRLLIGTGKYKDFDETRRAVEASGAEIVTVAIRRTNIGQNANEPSLLHALPPSSTPTCRIPPAATAPTTQCARCASRASFWTGTIS